MATPNAWASIYSSRRWIDGRGRRGRAGRRASRGESGSGGLREKTEWWKPIGERAPSEPRLRERKPRKLQEFGGKQGSRYNPYNIVLSSKNKRHANFFDGRLNFEDAWRILALK